MKVFIDYELNDSGKGKFLSRLIPALDKIGVKCQFKQKGCDISLGLSKWRSKAKRPRILRIDGIAIKNKWKNKIILKSMRKADAIIFQSKFAQRYVRKHLFKHHREYVIYNGANPEDYKVEPFKSHHNDNVIMFARWGKRKHKRLKAHLKYAKAHPESHFWLAGACNVKATDNLTVLGKLSDRVLARYIVMADKMVYLADIDWCPNSVVEARIAGLPIIYDENCEAVKELCSLNIEELHIDRIAKKYKEVFEEVL